MLDYFKRVIDRIILPQFPIIKSYKVVDKEKINEGYKGLVVIYSCDISDYYAGTDEWNPLINLTRSCYKMSGIDDEYILAAIGVKTKYDAMWWIWKLGNEPYWETNRNKNLEFHRNRRNQNT